jgi:general secretion pathway protein E
MSEAGTEILEPRLPYGFAKRFGLAVIGEEAGRVTLAMRQGADPRALVEARRFLARPLAVRPAAVDEFDHILS